MEEEPWESITMDAMLSERLAELIDSDMCDVLFVLDGDGDDETIGAVRAILACQSPVFKALLYSGFAESSQDRPTIRLPFAAAPFRAFLRFMHGGRLTMEEDSALLCELLHLADHFDATPVKIACSALLEQQLGLLTAFPLLVQADMYNAAVLKATCLEYIAANAGRLFSASPPASDSASPPPERGSPLSIIAIFGDRVLDTEALASVDPSQLAVLPPELLATVLERDDLDAEEFTLYCAVLRWAELRAAAAAATAAKAANSPSSVDECESYVCSSSISSGESSSGSSISGGCGHSSGRDGSRAAKVAALGYSKPLEESVACIARPLLSHIRFAFIPAKELKHEVFPLAVVEPQVIISALAWQLGCDDEATAVPTSAVTALTPFALPPPPQQPSLLALAYPPAADEVSANPIEFGPGATTYACRNPVNARAPFHGGLPTAGGLASSSSSGVATAAAPGSAAGAATAAAAAAAAKALTPRRPKVRKASPAALQPRRGWAFLPGPKALCPDTHNGGAVLCCDRLFATYGNDGAAGNRLRVVALDTGREATVELPFSTRGAVPAGDEAGGWVYVFEDSDRIHGAGAARINARTLELEELPTMPARHCRFAGAAAQGGKVWTLTRPGLLSAYDPQAEAWHTMARVPGSAALLAADPTDPDRLWLLHSSGKLRRYGIAADALEEMSDWPGTFFSLSASRPLVAMPRIGGGVLLASHACHAWHAYDSLGARWLRVAGWPDMDHGAHCVYDSKRGRLLFQQRGKSHWQWIQVGV